MEFEKDVKEIVESFNKDNGNKNERLAIGVLLFDSVNKLMTKAEDIIRLVSFVGNAQMNDMFAKSIFLSSFSHIVASMLSGICFFLEEFEKINDNPTVNCNGISYKININFTNEVKNKFKKLSNEINHYHKVNAEAHKILGLPVCKCNIFEGSNKEVSQH